MADNIRVVLTGKMIVSGAPDDVLVAYGLGSCVAVCLYDPLVRVGGMLHALLPSAANENRAQGSPTKFVDQGTPLLINSLLQLGGRRTRLAAHLCGGAHMVSAPDFEDLAKVGEHNVLAAEAALQVAGLRVQARAIGGCIGRTVRLYIATGQVTVKTLGQGEQILNVKRGGRALHGGLDCALRIKSKRRSYV